jgi:hypothetical protein
MDNDHLIITILNSLKNQVIPKWAEYNITIHQYGDLIDQMMNDGLIKGAVVERAGRNNKTIMVFLKGAKLTGKGLDYLKKTKLE